MSPQVALARRPLGRTGLSVTLLGFGALEIGRDWGLGSPEERRRPSEEEAGRTLVGVLDLGVNLIDTARAYHRSEERIGRFLSSRRGEFVLATKCGEHSREPGTYYDFSYQAVSRSIDESLQALRTDVIDVLQIHFGPDPQRVLDEGETLRAMQDAKQAGKVRFLGASPPAHLIPACLATGAFDVLQVHYNLLEREAEAGLELARRHGVGILVRGALAHGRLTPRVQPYLSEEPELAARLQPYLDLVGGDFQALERLALAFVAAHPAVSSILVGTRTLAHLVQARDLLDAGVPEAWLSRARDLSP